MAATLFGIERVVQAPNISTLPHQVFLEPDRRRSCRCPVHHDGRAQPREIRFEAHRVNLSPDKAMETERASGLAGSNSVTGRGPGDAVIVSATRRLTVSGTLIVRQLRTVPLHTGAPWSAPIVTRVEASVRFA